MSSLGKAWKLRYGCLRPDVENSGTLQEQLRAEAAIVVIVASSCSFLLVDYIILCTHNAMRDLQDGGICETGYVPYPTFPTYPTPRSLCFLCSLHFCVYTATYDRKFYNPTLCSRKQETWHRPIDHVVCVMGLGMLIRPQLSTCRRSTCCENSVL